MSFLTGGSTILLLSCCIGLARSVHERFELPGFLFTNQYYIEMSTVVEHCISVTRRYRSVHTGIMRIYIYCTKRSQVALPPVKRYFIPFFHCSYVLFLLHPTVVRRNSEPWTVNHHYQTSSSSQISNPSCKRVCSRILQDRKKWAELCNFFGDFHCSYFAQCAGWFSCLFVSFFCWGGISWKGGLYTRLYPNDFLQYRDLQNNLVSGSTTLPDTSWWDVRDSVVWKRWSPLEV